MAADDQAQRHMLEQLLLLPATDLHTALAQVSQLLADALRADKIDCFLFDPLRSTLFALGTSDTPMARQQRALGLDAMQLANDGRTVEVFQTGKPYIDGNVRADPKELMGIREALGVQSTIAVPLDVGGDRRGVVQAASAQRDFFSEADLRFLAAAARWVGAVAHRAELVDEMATQATQRARQQAADELITVLAHDLGNFLSPLVAHLDLLERRAAREGRSVDLSDARASRRIVHRLQRLIGDVLDVARIDEGLLALQRRPLDLMVLAQEVAQTLGTRTTAVHLRGPAECVVSADPSRLRQALENVVSNAVRHSPPGQEVLLDVLEQAGEEGTWATITVIDQGPGIPEELLPRLFGRFTSGPGSTGLGLGLFLARSIVEAHGGTVAVDSSGATGTCLTLRLPTGRDPEPLSPPSA